MCATHKLWQWIAFWSSVLGWKLNRKWILFAKTIDWLITWRTWIKSNTPVLSTIICRQIRRLKVIIKKANQLPVIYWSGDSENAAKGRSNHIQMYTRPILTEACRSPNAWPAAPTAPVLFQIRPLRSRRHHAKCVNDWMQMTGEGWQSGRWPVHSTECNKSGLRTDKGMISVLAWTTVGEKWIQFLEQEAIKCLTLNFDSKSDLNALAKNDERKNTICPSVRPSTQKTHIHMHIDWPCRRADPSNDRLRLWTGKSRSQ